MPAGLAAVKTMKIALLCSGLGHIVRGHEVFARDLFELLSTELDVTLFKGAGEQTPRERVVPCVYRTAPQLDKVHTWVAPKWAEAVREQERTRIEHETFAYGAIGPLLEGAYDIVHCLEQEACNILYDNRHLFAKPPKIVFSNGGAIPATELPRCDFVQEHTPRNFERSARGKAFMIPHGVDTRRFHPGVSTTFRQRHNIGAHEFLVLSVGTIGINHKRMDHVIREVAPLSQARLVIVGQESAETPAIKALGRDVLGERVVFTKLAHEELPQAYAAADAFVLGSLFETFGIVYIEAMAMGLPVFCTEHPNQRDIVKEGVFVDMSHPGALTAALRDTGPEELAALRRRGPQIVAEHYDLELLRRRYIEQYRRMLTAPCSLPRYTARAKVRANVRNAIRRASRLLHGQAR